MNTGKRLSVMRDFKTEVLPTLAGGLFRQAKGKVFACVSNDGVLVAISLRVASDSIRRYSFELGAMNIFEPHDFICLNVGGKFPDFHNGTSYNAKDQVCLDRSMRDVADKFATLDREWIVPVLSQSGLAKRLLELKESAPHLWGTGHICRSLGYSSFRKDEFDKGIAWLTEAKDQFQKTCNDNPYAQWAIDAVGDCDRLLTLADAGPDKLLPELDENRVMNIKSMKLEEAIAAQQVAESEALTRPRLA